MALGLDRVPSVHALPELETGTANPLGQDDGSPGVEVTVEQGLEGVDVFVFVNGFRAYDKIEVVVEVWRVPVQRFDGQIRQVVEQRIGAGEIQCVGVALGQGYPVAGTGGGDSHQTEAAADLEHALLRIRRQCGQVAGQQSGGLPQLGPEGKIVQWVVRIDETVDGGRRQQLQRAAVDGDGDGVGVIGAVKLVQGKHARGLNLY